MAGLCRQAACALQAPLTATTPKALLSRGQPCCSTLLTSRRSKSDLTAYKRGRGGRSSFSGIVATVFGASGFLGRYVVNQLGKIGAQVVIPYRCPEYDVDHLKLMGDLGQILFTPFYLRDEASIRKAMKYSNVVINLVGREWETKNFTFDDVHVAGAELIARVAAEQRVEKLIHLSAINASDPQYTLWNKASQFTVSKGKGEQAVRDHFPEAVIMRPSDMWGDEDRYLNYYASHYRRHFNSFPLWQKGENTIKQPVDVRNVAQGIIKAITEKGTNGTTFECVGPSSYYLSDLVDYYFDEMRMGHIRKIPILPSFKLKAQVCETIFPATPPMSRDKLIREASSDILTGCPTLEDLGVKPAPLEPAARYLLKVHRDSPEYEDSLGEIDDAPPPPTVAEIEEAKKVYF